MITDCPPITEIPDYVWRMKQPSYYPRPKKNEPKDTAPIFYHTNCEEALKDLEELNEEQEPVKVSAQSGVKCVKLTGLTA